MAHVVDGHDVDGDEDNAHYVEVHGAPVFLQHEIRIPGQEHHDKQFLSLVGESHHVLARHDLEQQQQDRHQVQEIPDQLEYVHPDYYTAIIINIMSPSICQTLVKNYQSTRLS